MYRITVIPGDGIGGEVMDAALTVLDALDLNPELIMADAGDDCLERTGTPLPDETLEAVGEADATLFGAAGESAADVIVKLRREFGLFANLRPVRSLPGVPCLYPDLDFVIVRENTEDLYVGDEEYTSDGAVARRVITRGASERIVRFALIMRWRMAAAVLRPSIRPTSSRRQTAYSGKSSTRSPPVTPRWRPVTTMWMPQPCTSSHSPMNSMSSSQPTCSETYSQTKPQPWSEASE